jgi:hypothetical protein
MNVSKGVPALMDHEGEPTRGRRESQATSMIELSFYNGTRSPQLEQE